MVETNTSDSKSDRQLDCRPVQKIRPRIWKHVTDWSEAYLVLPLVLLALPGSALLVYFLTGRSPQESADWIVDLEGRVLVASLAVLFSSLTRQATGFWMTKEENLNNRYLATLQAGVKIAYLIIFVWLFTH